MGAADVIPFMPVRDATMADAVTLARAFAADLARELDLPVYLYDRAALLPERASLADVRRGEYEGLRDAVARGERLPGPRPARDRPGRRDRGRRPGPARRVQRLPLGDRRRTPAKDDRRARSASPRGGLPALRAIGFAVPERGCVTVSMNLVDHEVTGLVDGVRRRRGRGFRPRVWMCWTPRSWGSCPAAALGEGVAAHVRLAGFDPDAQVLERLIEEGT